MRNTFIPDSSYQLDTDERYWIEQTARTEGRLTLAVMLKLFQAKKCFPDSQSQIPPDMVSCLSTSLGVAADTLSKFDWKSKTASRYRNAIRKYLGFRPPTFADREKLTLWLIENPIPKAPTPAQCMAYAEDYFHTNRLEPMAKAELQRVIKSAIHRFEQRLKMGLLKSMSGSTAQALDKLLENKSNVEPDEDGESNVDFQMFQLRKDMAGTKQKHIQEAAEQLECLRKINLPVKALEKIPRPWLQKYALRAMVEHPSHLKLDNDLTRYTLMACFCFQRLQALTDQKTDALLKMIHKLKKSAETHITKKIVSEVKKVNGKFDILYQLAKISADCPDGIISETIYPKVSQDILQNLATELSYQGKWFQHHVHVKMHSLYSHARRLALFSVLAQLRLETDDPKNMELLKAVDWILMHRNSSSAVWRDIDKIPLLNELPAYWKERIIESKKSNNKSITQIVKQMPYEMAVFEMLFKPLRCKAIWVKDAWRYRHPKKDLPPDFNDRRGYYYKTLGLTENAKEFVQPLRRKVDEMLGLLNAAIPNDKVKILEKNNGHIKISPFQAQEDPTHLRAFQQEIQRRWSTISLLDLLKETVLRTNLTKHFHTAGRFERMDPALLRKKILLCLYAIGSNTGLKRMSAANAMVTESDLRYVKRRYIHEANIRAAIQEIINSILEVKDPRIWGAATTGCACDSTQVSSWDQNMMSEWHARYHEQGVMIYWHVDQDSTCIYSQLKTCTSSEVASMIRGILRHCTKMEMKQGYTDTHGQSTVGFGLCYLLNFDLLPRLKNISRQKLCYSSAADKKKYPNISAIMKDTIDWDMIEKYYDDIVQHAAALKMGIVEPEVLLKRFSKDNYASPVYKALNELGKAVKTIFLCRYLLSEELRIEINEALNVVERLNSIMGFIFYGKLGEISTNRTEDQLLSVLCLHLLQVSMGYINTLMIQEVLRDPQWNDRLTGADWRALSPMIHGHINPYGLFPLDMHVRIPIESPVAA